MEDWPTMWVVGREWDSGRTSGVEMSHFMSPSPFYFPSLCLRMLGFRMFGIPLVMGMAVPLFSQGHLMIGRSSWWSIFCRRSKPSGCKGRRLIEYSGQLQSVALSQSSLFILFWSSEILLCSLVIVFEGWECLLR